MSPESTTRTVKAACKEVAQRILERPPALSGLDNDVEAISDFIIALGGEDNALVTLAFYALYAEGLIK